MILTDKRRKMIMITDDNLAERTIRKLTTQRNNSLHYGSDAGTGMAS